MSREGCCKGNWSTPIYIFIYIYIYIDLSIHFASLFVNRSHCLLPISSLLVITFQIAREAAAHALGGLSVKNNEVIGCLIETLQNDVFPIVRKEAIRSLVKLKDSSDVTINALIHRLKLEPSKVTFYSIYLLYSNYLTLSPSSMY